MTDEQKRIAIAEADGQTIYEELGIRYKDGMESFGNSPEYTAQKCANYQRQGLGCELIKRKQCAEDFDPLNNRDDIVGAILRRFKTDDEQFDFIRALNNELDPHPTIRNHWTHFFMVATATPAQLSDAYLAAK